MKKITDFSNFDYESATNDLKTKFNDKMLDDEFFKYANNLKNAKAYLYTHSIEQVLLEKSNCVNCTNLNHCPNLIKGHYLELASKNDNIVEYYIACDKLKNMEYLKNVTIFGKSKENTDITTHSEFYRDSNRKEVVEYINKIIEENNINTKGIYLSGAFGTGKSYIMSLLIKKLAKQGYKCGFAYFPELLVELKKEFSINSQSLLDKVKTLDVLVLDDLGAEKVTEWSRDEVLGTILQYRMDNKLFTCFTSNYNLEQLLHHFNKDKEVIKASRVVDRVKFLTKEFELVGENYRNK